MKPNINLVSHGLKYGFLSHENTNFNLRTNIQQSSNLQGIFEETINNIGSISKKTDKKIYLSLSGGVDSVIVYGLFKKYNLDFTAINISFGDEYSEKNEIKKIFGDDNIIYIDIPSHNWLDTLSNMKFKYFTTHPIINGYYHLIKNIPNNAILVTGDLGDEFFKNDNSLRDGDYIKGCVFENNEIAMMMGEGFKISNINYNFKNIIEEDIYFYENVTLKSILNNISELGKNDLIYYPFSRNFLPYSQDIVNMGLKNKTKSFLINYAKILGINFDSNYKTIGFKYKKNENTTNEYLEYVKANKDILLNYGINISDEFLTYMRKNLLKNRWKIFSLVVFIILFKKGDTRFFINQKK